MYAQRFAPGKWSFLGPGSEKKWYSTHDSEPQGEWDRVAELMMIKFSESGHPVFRATSPLSRRTLKSKGGENCQYTFALTRERLKLFCAQLFLLISSVFTEQSQICVKNVKVKPAIQERSEKLSQKDRVIKFCTDAGFLTTVEVGQYFMTKDTEEFSQFTVSVACREYTLPRDEDSSEPKGWIRGNTKIGPVLEGTTSYLQGKYGVEIRIESINKDHSHSWVRISHGLNKLVTDLTNKEHDDNEQETSGMQFEDCALKSNASDFASRSKAKAKPQRRNSASSSTRIFPIGEKTCTDIEPQKYSLSDYPVSKKLMNLLRHGSLPRDNDGAIEHHWSDEKWKSSTAGGGGNKKQIQYCIDSSGTILYLRALQGHSGRNLIDPSLQDNVVIPDGFFKYIYHVGCAINLHSIMNSGLTAGGQKF